MTNQQRLICDFRRGLGLLVNSAPTELSPAIRHKMALALDGAAGASKEAIANGSVADVALHLTSLLYEVLSDACAFGIDMESLLIELTQLATKEPNQSQANLDKLRLVLKRKYGFFRHGLNSPMGRTRAKRGSIKSAILEFAQNHKEFTMDDMVNHPRLSLTSRENLRSTLIYLSSMKKAPLRVVKRGQIGRHGTRAVYALRKDNKE